MTSDKWARVRSVLDSVLEQPEADRQEFLNFLCVDDPELRAEVAELLALESRAESLFSEARWDFDSVALDSLAPGTRVGPYRIVRLIGEGGMGSVHLAERADGVYSQQVALKVMHRGMLAKDALERFVRERQTLARLNHHGIARLFDGGVLADGRPYLVMEYVEGRPITRYCDEEKLTIRERIQLAVRICEAVQNAHQNLIIHRDLKPANILVTGTGEPKLLDFGIAKWLEDGADSKSTIQLLTPSYTTPEQACQEPVSTATDVYSLAAVLFELLTGSLPHPIEGLSPHEAIRCVAETEPGLASEAAQEAAAEARRTTAKTLRRNLQGDLDTILRKALRREPERRYPTVQEFAADLGRYLAHLPIEAKADSILYRASKFIQRRKALVTLSAGSLGALIVALLGTWHAYTAAQAQRAIAERRYENGRQLVQSYLTEVDRKLEGLPGTTAVRGLIARRNLEYLDRMAPDAGGDLPLQRELAQAYFLIARTQRMSAQSSAERQQARVNLDKAVHLRQAIFDATGDIQDRGQLAYLLSQTGALLVQDGRLLEAIAYHRRACSLARPIFAGPVKGLNYLRAANACWNLATDYAGNEQAPHIDKVQQGLQGQLETLERFKRWRDGNTDNPIGDPYVASMEALTAADLWRTGSYEEAKRHFEVALAILHGPRGMLSHELAAGYLVMAQVDFSMMLAERRQYAAALPHAEEALSLTQKRVAALKERDPGWESMEAFAQVALGRVLALNGRGHEGVPLIERGLSTLRAEYLKDPSDAEALGALAQCDLWAIDGELTAHVRSVALQHCQEVVRLSTAALRQDPEDASAAGHLKEASAKLAIGE